MRSVTLQTEAHAACNEGGTHYSTCTFCPGKGADLHAHELSNGLGIQDETITWRTALKNGSIRDRQEDRTILNRCLGVERRQVHAVIPIHAFLDRNGWQPAPLRYMLRPDTTALGPAGPD
eukprot:COSAG04_NODE_160_length_22034_cov_4.774151_1_plen_120_part_00